MKLWLYGYSAGTQVEKQEISVDDAQKLIVFQQTYAEEKDNYIGFQIPEKEPCIQFCREDSTYWVIDIPIYRGDEYVRAIHGKTSTRIILDLLEDLFDENAELNIALTKENYDEVENILLQKWGIELTPVVE